ncbi:hypothetical protein KAOT1_19072 [Kordia algicida OT-1]|uniref:Uncharacterized protein n=1 Tax=Kordia algicida OT-1 TaxID=391587 RepID=A9DNW3_9FLAO|nr:hypothetical protein KAOT1_19072 [Kordia algicida OT-1]
MNADKLQFLKGFITGFLTAIIFIIAFVIVALYYNLEEVL